MEGEDEGERQGGTEAEAGADGEARAEEEAEAEAKGNGEARVWRRCRPARESGEAMPCAQRAAAPYAE